MSQGVCLLFMRACRGFFIGVHLNMLKQIFRPLFYILYILEPHYFKFYIFDLFSILFILYFPLIILYIVNHIFDQTNYYIFFL